MQLTVKDTAKLLAVSEKTIYRWIRQENIPYYRVNEQYRFHRSELLEWATARKLQVSPEIFREKEAGPGALPSLQEALKIGGICYRVGGGDKASVLRRVVDLLSLPEEVDRGFLYEVLMARESLGSTGIGDGIAIPHVRNPVVLHVQRPCLTLCFLEEPIEFGAIDGQPVHTLFTLVTPSVRSHLHLLSRLAYALRSADFQAVLRSQASRDELMAAVQAAEAAIPASSEGR